MDFALHCADYSIGWPTGGPYYDSGTDAEYYDHAGDADPGLWHQLTYTWWQLSPTGGCSQ